MLISVQSDSHMRALGASLASSVSGGCLIFLEGPIGAGKTTLTQGLLEELGVGDAVTSPTFSLVEVYDLPDPAKVKTDTATKAWHFDLYRIEDPEELELIGVRESFNGQDIVIVEWPENGKGVLPAPDIRVLIRYPQQKASQQRTAASSCDRDTELMDKSGSNRHVTIINTVGDCAAIRSRDNE